MAGYCSGSGPPPYGAAPGSPAPPGPEYGSGSPGARGIDESTFSILGPPLSFSGNAVVINALIQGKKFAGRSCRPAPPVIFRRKFPYGCPPCRYRTAIPPRRTWAPPPPVLRLPWWDKMRCCKSRDFSSGMSSSLQTLAHLLSAHDQMAQQLPAGRVFRNDAQVREHEFPLLGHVVEQGSGQQQAPVDDVGIKSRDRKSAALSILPVCIKGLTESCGERFWQRESSGRLPGAAPAWSPPPGDSRCPSWSLSAPAILQRRLSGSMGATGTRLETSYTSVVSAMRMRATVICGPLNSDTVPRIFTALPIWAGSPPGAAVIPRLLYRWSPSGPPARRSGRGFPAEEVFR